MLEYDANIELVKMVKPWRSEKAILFSLRSESQGFTLAF
jgi:hypothetical protein